MCGETVERGEGCLALPVLAAVRLFLGVHPHVHLQCVGGEEGLGAVRAVVPQVSCVRPDNSILVHTNICTSYVVGAQPTIVLVCAPGVCAKVASS